MTDQSTILKTNYGDVTVTMPDYSLDSGATLTTSYTGPQGIYPQAIDTFTLSSDTITVNTDTLSPITWNDPPNQITLGKSVLTEEKFQKLEALLDLIEGMGKSDLLDMLNTQLSLNKVKNGETTSN